MYERAVAFAAVVCLLLGAGLALKATPEEATLDEAPADEPWRAPEPEAPPTPEPQGVPLTSRLLGDDDEDDKEEKDDEERKEGEKARGKGKGRGKGKDG